MGEAKLGEVGQERDDLGRRILQAADLRGQTAQLQHHGRFERIVGVAPDPGALGVRSPERQGHHTGDQLAVQGA